MLLRTKKGEIIQEGGVQIDSFSSDLTGEQLFTMSLDLPSGGKGLEDKDIEQFVKDSRDVLWIIFSEMGLEARIIGVRTVSRSQIELSISISEPALAASLSA